VGSVLLSLSLCLSVSASLCLSVSLSLSLSLSLSVPLGIQASVKAIDKSGTWRDQGHIDAVLVRDRSSQPLSQSDV
jgi:hypothetical protein